MNDKLIEVYMAAYLYELEHMLNINGDFFKDVKFQLDEANTDKDLKNAIKKFITNNCNAIMSIDVVKIDGIEYHLNLNDFAVCDVFVPDDYNDEINDFVKKVKKGAIFVKPDMVLKCRFKGQFVFQTIEFKSTKNNKIPGSSVQQILPNEWVIFIKHNSKDGLSFITGKYKDSISKNMQFPDRSPRPQVSYDELYKWIKQYRDFNNRVLVIKNDAGENEKIEILTDWQEVLSKRWLNVIKSDSKGKKEPWFNNNLRKFMLVFLKYYDDLNKDEQIELKKKISKNIIEKENGEE